MSDNQIGAVIRSIRKRKGITATFMAKNLGYKVVSSYTRLENGGTVTLEQAKKIADLLMVDVNDLLNAENLRETRTS